MTRWFVATLALLMVLSSALVAEEKPKDTKRAAKTRKLLKKKVEEVDFDNFPLSECLEELKEYVPGFTYKFGTGVSRNQKIKYKAKNKTLAEILDGMFKKPELGYYVKSKLKDAYDGVVYIRQGNERGYPKKKD